MLGYRNKQGMKKGGISFMIDIHTHILPGIDDGSESLSESFEMAELAVQSGVHTIVSTPHCNMEGIYENFYDELWEERLGELCSYLRERGNQLMVLSGMEIYASMDVAEKIQKGMLLPVNDSRYYLIEFSFDVDPLWMGDILSSILQIRKIPLIAHPERYYCVQDQPMLLYEWMQQGCLTQLNKGSVFGRFGRHAQRTADLLLNYGLATCVASDAHSSSRRTTYMEDIKEYLCREYEKSYADNVLKKNPRRIIMNQDISTEGILRPERKIWIPFL